MNVSYMVVNTCTDDSFDWTEGWNGTGSNLIAFQAADLDCDCLIEADNNENNYAATPVSHPVLSNLTLVGHDATDKTRGIRLRRGTQVEIRNAKVCGKGKAITLESKETEQALLDGKSVLSGIESATELNSKEGIYTNDNFVAAGNTVNASLSFADFAAIVSANSRASGWTK